VNISLGVAQVFDRLTSLRVGAAGQDFFSLEKALGKKKLSLSTGGLPHTGIRYVFCN
jgi:hypothetical protein